MLGKRLLIILMLLGFSLAFAQSTSKKVFGTIQDNAGNGLPYVTIELYTKGDMPDLISGGITDDSGQFILEDEVPFGTYELVMMAIGFADEVKDITIDQEVFDLGILKIGNEVVQLQGAEIRAEVSQYRNEIDKRVVEVGRDLVSAGADAAAVLNNIQSVTVDPQTGDISLRGNDNVKVLVDGKPSNMPASQLLKQLPSNSIAKVEIITNPSAKYEAEGNSGIINIITQKTKRKGYNVGLNLGFTQGDNSRFNGSINSNINVGKFNFFANYNANTGKNYHYGHRLNYATNLNQTFGVQDDNFQQLMKFGFDWFISDATALTVYANLGFVDGTGFIKSTIMDDNIGETYENFSGLDGYGKSLDLSFNLKQNLGRDDHFFTLDGLYSKSDEHDWRDNDNLFPVEYYYENRLNDVSQTRVNLDYSNALEGFGNIEAGLQFRKEENGNYLDSDRVLQSNGNDYNPFVDYDFKRDTYAAYLNYSNTFGKFGIQAGLRAEQVDENAGYEVNPTGEGKYENNYFELYPSAFLTYDVNEKGQISLSYSRRVDRPGINQISPMPQWTLATIQNEGNPDLKPQFTNSFEMGYLQKFKGGSFNAVAFYRQVNDRIFRYFEEHPYDENITVLKWINYDKSYSYGLELSANYKPTKWWNSNLSFDLFANEMELDGIKKTAKPFSIRANNNFTVTKNLSVQNFFMYRGPYEFVQGKMQPMWSLDLGARYSFMDGKASFTARVTDIFKQMKAEGDLYLPTPGFTLTKWESQTFYVGFSYNFGGDVRKRNIQQNDSQSLPGGGLGL